MTTTNSFYAAVVTSSRWIEGDERSKQFPGHGYPGHHEDTTEFIKFKSEADMIEFATDRKNCKIYLCTPVELETTVTVKVKK